MSERERSIAVNEAVFRAVNDRLGGLNEAFSLFTDTMLAVCECGDANCIEQFDVAAAFYEDVRSDPLLFLVRPGHEIPETETVVTEHNAFSVVRKRERDGIDDIAETTWDR